MKDSNEPPANRTVSAYSKVLPLLGPALEVTKDTGRFVENFAAECGPMGSFRFMGSRSIVTSDPGLANYVLESKNYRKVDNNNRFARAIGDGLLTSNGKKWSESRKVVQPLFAANYIEDVFVKNAVEIVEQTKQRWREATKKGPAIINLREEMNEISFRIGLRILFGRQNIGLDTIKALYSNLVQMKKYIVKIPPRQWLELRRIFMAPEYISFLKARKSYNNIIRMLISEHAANRSEESDEVFLIDHLMHAMKNNPKFAPDTFETELTTLAFASSFSTGIALQWMWVLMDQNRSTVDLIRQVIAEYLLNPMQLDETTKIKAYADLCGNTVVQACIKEVLRMYPPFWFQARKALVDDEFEGIHIKKGTCVLINVVMLHRSINVWKMPNSFDHTRFLDPESQSIPNGAYIPFGGGLRRCPASQMASVEMAVVATMLLDEFDVVIQNPVSLRATKEPDLLMESDQPIRAQIVKRSAIG